MIELHIDAETGVAELILNNPKAMNSLGEADLAGLSDALDEAAKAHPAPSSCVEKAKVSALAATSRASTRARTTPPTSSPTR